MRPLAILPLLLAGTALAQQPTPPIGAARTTETPPPIRQPLMVPQETPGSTSVAEPALTPVAPAVTSTGGAVVVPMATPLVPVEGRTIVAPAPGAERNLEPPAWTGAAGTALANAEAFRALSPLRKAWFLREHHRAKGDAEAAKKALDTLIDLRLDAGIENATPLAAALVREARLLAKEKKAAEGVDIAKAAVQLAPDWPQAWVGLVRAQLAAGKYGEVAASARGAMASASRNLRARVRIVADVWAAGVLGILLAWVIFLLAMYLRHGRFVVHDFKHALADKMPTFVAAVILVPFLAFPIVFGLGALPLLAWLTLAIWMKMTMKERAVAAVLLVLAAATPWVLRHASGPLAFEAGPASRLYAALHEDEVFGRDLEELAAEAEDDADALLALGITHQRAGRYTEAEKTFARAEEKGAGAAAIVGRGVARYGMGDVATAIGAFEKAVALDARNLAAHYNLARIYNERAELEKHKVSWAQARAIDGGACDVKLDELLPVQRKAAVEVGGTLPVVSAPWVNRFLMLDVPSNDRLLARAVAEGSPAIARQTWRRLSPALPLGATTALFLGLLAVGGVMTAAFRDVTPSRPCPRCGRGLCLRCDGPPLEGDYCVQCYHAFIDTEGVDPKQRMLKEREVRVYEDRRRRKRAILSVLLPGAGHLFGGNTVRGAILALVAGIAAARLLAWRGWLRPAYPDAPSLPLFAIGFAGLVLAIAWIAGLRGHDEGAA